MFGLVFKYLDSNIRVPYKKLYFLTSFNSYLHVFYDLKAIEKQTSKRAKLWKIILESIELKRMAIDNDTFGVLIGVSMGIIIFLILLCGLHNCFCKESTITENSTRNNSLSDNDRVQIEENSNSPTRFERTEDL